MECLAAHADWSVAAAKRWMSVATPRAAGWDLHTERVGDVGTLLDRLRARTPGLPVALGIDSPIGVPYAFAARHLGSHPDFPTFLAGLPRTDPFFTVCHAIEEVGPGRPFFPHSPAHAPRRLEQAARLGVARHDDLLRRCDRATPTRPRAACMFWTLGSAQVGKAALSLWRDLLPTVPPGSLWPYDGPLATLLRHRACAVAETYPAEALRQIGLRLRGSKRRQADRTAVRGELTAIIARLGASPDLDLAAEIATGFGNDGAGEDRFDSLVGLLGLLQVIREPARDTVPADDRVHRFEGWILGQPVLERHAAQPLTHC